MSQHSPTLPGLSPGVTIDARDGRPGERPASNPVLIHPTAIIHPAAELHPSVVVGPYAVIGAGVRVGAQTTIGPHVVIEGETIIGQRNRFFSGAAIGTDPQDRKYTGGSSRVEIGNDNLIREYVTINRATGEGEVTAIGNGNLIMAYAHVAHNCTLEDEIVLANGVALAGHVYIETRATVGGVLGIHQFVRVGRLAMLGGMSRIDRDVPPFMLVEGHPGRVRALNKIGLKRAGYGAPGQAHSLESLEQAFRILYRSGLTLEQAIQRLGELPDCDVLCHLRQFLATSRAGRRGLMPGRRRPSSEGQG